MTGHLAEGRQASWLVGLASLCALLAISCSQAALLGQETEHGGVVTYLFREDRGGPMGSPHRREALKLMEKKCPSGYHVVRDGEVRSSGASGVEGQERDVTGRRWGIKFQCK